MDAQPLSPWALLTGVITPWLRSTHQRREAAGLYSVSTVRAMYAANKVWWRIAWNVIADKTILHLQKLEMRRGQGQSRPAAASSCNWIPFSQLNCSVNGAVNVLFFLWQPLLCRTSGLAMKIVPIYCVLAR